MRFAYAFLLVTIGIGSASFAAPTTAEPQPQSTGVTDPQSAASRLDREKSRREKGNEVMQKLSGGAGQPVLKALSQDFPFLADAITDYALAEVWSRRGLDDRTRQLAAIAAFAAQGNLPQLTVHARYALTLGVSEAEIKEVIYLTTVTAGFPRAIDAAEALRKVFEPSAAR